MTKSADMCWRFKNILLRSKFLIFLCSLEYKVFEIDSLHVCGISTSLTICGSFSEFSKTQKKYFILKIVITDVYMDQISARMH
jgi:hypothetical protein